MKHLFSLLCLSLLLVCAIPAAAQSQSLEEVASKVAEIEKVNATLAQSMTQLQQEVATIQKKVEEVTAQNLALKSSLHLGKPKAEYKVTSNPAPGVIFKLIDCIGNAENHTITLEMEAVNTSVEKFQAQVQHTNETIITDIDGKIYNYDYFKGDRQYWGDNPECDMTNLNPDSMTKLTIVFGRIAGCPAYIKVANIKMYLNHSHNFGFEFKDIPVKWEQD